MTKYYPITYIPRFKELNHEKFLILGETCVGKTTFSLLFLYEILSNGWYTPDEISVLDFAPPRIKTGDLTIGGTISELFEKSAYDLRKIEGNLNQIRWINRICQQLNPEKNISFCAPRLSSKTPQEVYKNCCLNYQNALVQLRYFLDHSTKVVIINDIGIYLHLGSPFLIQKVLKKSETALLNAYYGINLKNDLGTNISLREKRMIEILSHSMKSVLNQDYIKPYTIKLKEMGLKK